MNQFLYHSFVILIWFLYEKNFISESYVAKLPMGGGPWALCTVNAKANITETWVPSLALLRVENIKLYYFIKHQTYIWYLNQFSIKIYDCWSLWMAPFMPSATFLIRITLAPSFNTRFFEAGETYYVLTSPEIEQKNNFSVVILKIEQQILYIKWYMVYI